MAWKLPPRLETERLLLRPCLYDDLGPFLGFITDERATRFLLFPEEHKTEHGATDFFHAILSSYESEHPIFALSILDRETGAFVGFCGLAPCESPDEAECFYAILPEFWGTGLATEAAGELLRHAFGPLRMQRVRAFILPENPRAVQVARKLGMRQRGCEKRDLSPEEGFIYSVGSGELPTREETSPG